MSFTLWVAEKKTLAEAVANVLPGTPETAWDQKGMTHNRVGDHVFVWLDGHAFEQAMPDHYLPDSVPKNSKGAKVWRQEDLPIVPTEWVILPKEAKQRRLDKLQELLQKCSVVHHLGDPDEEGQVLVDEALQYYQYKGPVKRVCVNDYNVSKVKQSIDAIRDNNEPLFRGWHNWGLARSRYDWLLGLNCTRAMTLRGRALGYDGGVLSVGSVQTPLLYIMRERDRTIENFKPIPYFTLSAHLKHANGNFKANWKAKEDQLGLDESNRLVDPAVAAALVARLTGKTATISGYTKKAKEQKVPLPPGMDELQIDAFKKYGYDGAAVLAAGQQLYEVYKVMSYPRSTIRHLSEAQHAGAADVMAAVFQLRPDLAGLAAQLDLSRKSDAFNDKMVDGTPHHAIVPSIPESPVDISKWSEVERNVYELVVRAYLAQFAAPYEYLATGIEVMVDGERFTTNGTTPVSQGWKAIYAEAEEKDKADDDDEGKGQTLPLMAEGDEATCEKCEQKSKKTSPPPRFDDGMITDALRDVYKFVTDEAARNRLKKQEDGTSGIGTSATRAPMVAELKDRGYIVPVEDPKLAAKGKLMTSPAARALIDALPLDVKDPTTAGVFKASLDQVAKEGEAAFNAFMAETVKWVTEIVKQAPTLQMTLPVAPGCACPKCEQGRLKRKESTKTKGSFFWFCTRWNADPKCDAIYPDKAGTPDTTPQASVPCPTCKTGGLRRKTNDKGAYWYCSNWNADPKCEAKFQDDKGNPDLTPPLDVDCPHCKQGKLRRKIGANGPFWYCSRWNADPKCEAKYQDEQGKPQLVLPEAIKCPICKSGALRRVPHGDKHFWACSNFKVETVKCPATFPDQGGRPNFNPAAKKGKR